MLDLFATWNEPTQSVNYVQKRQSMCYSSRSQKPGMRRRMTFLCVACETKVCRSWSALGRYLIARKTIPTSSITVESLSLDQTISKFQSFRSLLQQRSNVCACALRLSDQLARLPWSTDLARKLYHKHSSKNSPNCSSTCQLWQFPCLSLET